MQHSLASIAKRAGVSVATVSLALRGKGLVARKTAERIKKIADELQYRPNPLLASLATKRFRTAVSATGMPLAIFSFPALANSSARDGGKLYVDDLVREATKLGYAPRVHALENTGGAARVYRELYHSMVQGIIVLGSMDMTHFGREFDWSQFSVVVCGRYRAALPFHTVRTNVFNSVKLAFTELQARGYRRVGFAMGTHGQAMEDDEARHGAAIAMEYSYLHKQDRLPVYLGGFKDADALNEWVVKNKPDAVIGFSVGQYWLLRSRGHRIPEELGFASMHLPGKEEREFCSGLNQNTEEIARQSVLLLDQLVRNRERGVPANPLDVLVSSIWNEGKTLRPRPEDSL